jgi:hypothetical protein
MDMDWDVNKALRSINKALEVADLDARYLMILVPIKNKIGIYFYDSFAYNFATKNGHL